MKKLISIIALLAMVLCLFAGCAEEGPYEPTGDGLGEVISTETEPDPDDQSLCLIYYREKTLNPLTCSDYTNRVISPFCTRAFLR